ncbi:MAG: ABC transporter ATP-binding protein [Desulfobacterales bacterium]|nr:ABC transporter ATP-binding protein [Desulfobacterales bacterium]
MSLTLESVTKKVGRETHIDNISLAFEMGSHNVFLGRTLAGKTSLLRLMAGLDRPTSGRVTVNGEDVTGRSVRQRSVAMVYQQFINYPSLTIYDNIAAPLKFSGTDKAELDRRVRETAAMLRIDPLLDRLPAELSGGQQQRTAIARALVREAHLLLLDEPLVNLDYKLREELRVELQEIFKQRKGIVVYTTTEPSEALMMGGNIAVLHEGRLLQEGSTPQVYRHPDSTRVARVFSDPPINLADGISDGTTVTLDKDIQVPLSDHMKSLTPGSYRFGVHAHHLFLSSRSENDVLIDATVELSEISGSETFVHVHRNEIAWAVQEPGVHNHPIGSSVSVYVNPGNFFVFDEAGKLVAAPE